MDHQKARHLAEDWIAAWHAYDLEKLMAHYVEDVHFKSPRVTEAYTKSKGAIGSPDGIITSKNKLRDYFAVALKSISNLRLELLHVMLGLDNKVAIVYKRETGAHVTEVMKVRTEDGAVLAVEVFYGEGGM